MSRSISSKIKVECVLVAETPLSVGGMGGGEQVDLELAIDGRGRFYIPGSSIAGPLRYWTERFLVDGTKLADKMFGFQKDDEGEASRIFIEDAVVQSDGRERRHGIAIDRGSGVTREGFFYTRAILPKGTSFPLSMELDVPQEGSPLPEILFLLLDALCKGSIRFGAGKTRGYGRVRMENLRIDRYDFLSSDVREEDLRRWLDGERASVSGGLETLETPEDLRTVRLLEGTGKSIRIEWRPRSPLMVKSGRDGREADMLPLVSGNGEGLVPVLPGSALKGVFRSHAEKILRTLFLSGKQDDEAALDMIRDLFGDDTRSGRLFFGDVYALVESPPSVDEWFSEQEEVLDATTSFEQHVAIDRFTGGASEGALYSARPVKQSVSWEPILLALDFQKPLLFADDDGTGASRKSEPLPPLPEELREAEIALLELVTSDLRLGLIPLGFGSLRGLGEIEVASVDGLEAEDADARKRAWKRFVDAEGRLEAFVDAEEGKK